MATAKITGSLTREERWAQEDADLRAHGLFGGRAEEPPLAWAALPAEAEAEVADIRDSFEDLPSGEATWRTLDGLARLNQHYERTVKPARFQHHELRRRAPIALTLSMHHSRALRMGRPSALTVSEWTAVYESFRGRCAYCNGAQARTIDHVIPLSRGGSHDVENVVPACRVCNAHKGAKPLDAFLEAEGFDEDRIYERMAAARLRRQP